MFFRKAARGAISIPETGYKKISGLAQRLVRWSIEAVPWADKISANLLTATRIGAALLLWVIIIFFDWRTRLVLILTINGFSYVSDLFDGAVANVKNQKTKLGSWLDNTADKLLALPNLWIVFQLTRGDAVLKVIPIEWILVVIAAIDFLLISLRIAAACRKIHIEANYFGKVKILFQFAGFWLVELNFFIFPKLGVNFLGISAIFSGLSLIVHLITNTHLFLKAKSSS